MTDFERLLSALSDTSVVTTMRRPRTIWALGLLAYLLGGMFFALTPSMIPVVGGIVLLACTSALRTGPKDDIPVMVAAFTAVILGGFLTAVVMPGRLKWLDPVVPAGFYIGCLLPMAVIALRLWRPRPGANDN